MGNTYNISTAIPNMSHDRKHARIHDRIHDGISEVVATDIVCCRAPGMLALAAVRPTVYSTPGPVSEHAL